MYLVVRTGYRSRLYEYIGRNSYLKDHRKTIYSIRMKGDNKSKFNLIRCGFLHEQLNVFVNE